MAEKSTARINGEYVLARSVASVLTAVDLDAAGPPAKLIARLFFHFDRRHRERAIRHVATAYPRLPEAEVRRIALASCEHFARLAVESLHTPRQLTHDNWSRRVGFHNFNAAVDRLSSGRPVILLTGHLGNWELMGVLLALLGFELDAIARPLDNPKLNDWIMGLREQRGLRIITKFDATDRMVGVLERGGALGFIADQNAGDKGLFVPFMNRLASTYKSIGLLAQQYQASVICGYAHRLPPRPGDRPQVRYEMGVEDVIDPEDWQGQRDELFYITARYTRALEMMIRRRPEQYLWMHRRWKSRPRHERMDKPMSSGLQRNLEALPWMTDALMAEVATPVPPEPKRR